MQMMIMMNDIEVIAWPFKIATAIFVHKEWTTSLVNMNNKRFTQLFDWVESKNNHISSIIFFSGNTRVVNQKELEFFREELQNRLSSSYNVILKERKLPMSLLNDNQKV